MKMGISDLIPGVAEIKTGLGIAVGVAIIALGGWMVWEWKDLQHLKESNTILTENNKQLQENADILKANQQTCVATNTTDSATIASLLKDRQDAQNAVANLSKQQQSNVAAIGILGKKLSELEKNPANDGTLSPDLRETIRGIEGAK